MMPCGNVCLCQHWRMYWFVAYVTKPLPEPMLTNNQSGIHLDAISQEMLKVSTLDFSLLYPLLPILDVKLPIEYYNCISQRPISGIIPWYPNCAGCWNAPWKQTRTCWTNIPDIIFAEGLVLWINRKPTWAALKLFITNQFWQICLIHSGVISAPAQILR